jgi:uncharacterized surface protein with fasciclin (FAS1) repeats
MVVLFSLLLVLEVRAQDDVNQQAANNSYVRFVHLAPETDAVDIYTNGELSSDAALDPEAAGPWMAVTAGLNNFSLAPAGTSADQAVASLSDFDLPAGQWTTLLVTGPEEEGTLTVTPVIQDFSEMAPGVARLTFVNLLNNGLQVNFLRDGTPMVAELAPVGNDQGINNASTIPVDAGIYTFQAVETTNPENVIGELPNVEIVETTSYLIAAVNRPDGSTQLVIYETPLAEVWLAQGVLAEPGTLVEAAQTTTLLSPFADAINSTGLVDTLSGTGLYTVFAPADFVMDDLSNQFGGDSQALADYLSGFIVEGDYKLGQLIDAGTLTTLNGTQLIVTQEGDNVFVNGAQILDVNIPAMNGTIHIIGEQAPEGAGTGDISGAAATEEVGQEPVVTEAAPEATEAPNG